VKISHFNLTATFFEVCFELSLTRRAPLCNFGSSYKECQQRCHEAEVTQSHYKTNEEPYKTTEKTSATTHTDTTKLACLLISLIIAEGRRSPHVPTMSIVACPSPTVNTVFCLTSP